MSGLYHDTLTHNEIALEGADLISNNFAGTGENVINWSPNSLYRDLPLNTVQVFDDLDLSDSHAEDFKMHVRCLFKTAEIRELSYVEHFDGGNPILVALLDNSSRVDLKLGVYVCRAATWQWSIKKTLQETRYPKPWIDPIFNLLVPHYPNCDSRVPPGQLIAAETSKKVGVHCDD